MGQALPDGHTSGSAQILLFFPSPRKLRVRKALTRGAVGCDTVEGGKVGHELTDWLFSVFFCFIIIWSALCLSLPQILSPPTSG